jgi:hypothetical protein
MSDDRLAILSVCVCIIYLSDGGGHMGDVLLNRKAERAEFILNTIPLRHTVQHIRCDLSCSCRCA